MMCIFKEEPLCLAQTYYVMVLGMQAHHDPFRQLLHILEV